MINTGKGTLLKKGNGYDIKEPSKCASITQCVKCVDGNYWSLVSAESDTEDDCGIILDFNIKGKCDEGGGA
jgi:hypothetical protein